MVKGKKNGLTFTECSVKVCWILLLSPPYWKWSYHNATQSKCAHRLEDNIFQIDRSLVLMRACFLLSSFWWKMSKKFSLLKEPTSSLFAYTHRRPRLAERKRTLFTLRERKAICETKSDASHVQANSYTTFSETWLSSPSVWKCCVGKFLFHEGIYEEKRIHNILLFSLHNH